jgi:DNA topoisomerase-3
MQLVITEKMSVGKSIAEVAGITKMKGRYMEGNGYLVSWCVGHLVELAQPESYGERWKKWTYGSLPVKPEKWKYEVRPDTREQYEVLAGLMHREDVDCVICATDVGRILRTFKIKKNVR